MSTDERYQRGSRAPISDLETTTARILESLGRDGVATAAFTELFDRSLWVELETDIEPFVRSNEASIRDEPHATAARKDEYLVQRFWSKRREELHRFSLDDPWLRIYASTTVLDVVNGYRREWTRLRAIDNWFTVPYSGAVDRIASQRWHRDPEEAHEVKVFVYVSDVNEGAGPFEYIAGSAPSGRYGQLWPWGKGKRYPPEDKLLAAIDPSDRLTLAGPAGTMIFADTSGLHRGGFARKKPRIMGTSMYLTEAARVHAERRFDLGFDLDQAELAPQVRFALQ